MAGQTATAATTIQADSAPPAPDLAALKTRQQAAWSSGNYAIVGATLQIVGEELCEALDLKAGSKVLDVAAGNGMASLAAARRWCDVTSTDYVPALLERGQARAAAEGMQIEFREADAENLPFDDNSFDTVLSTFGVMFTPNQDRAAAELMRVCKPKGQIGLANWTPEGFIGQVFKTLGKYLPPPAGDQIAGAVGNKRAADRNVRRRGALDQSGIAPVQVPLSLAVALPRRVQDLLRPGAESVRRPRAGETGRAA